MTIMVTQPARIAVEVTPSDATTYDPETRGIYVGVSGDLKVDLAGSGTVTFVGLAAGIIHPIAATKIYSTDTDADNIVATFHS